MGDSCLPRTPRAPAHHEEHLALVLVGQQEEPQHRGVGDLVVEGLAVQVQEGGVDADVVAASGRQALQLPEDAEASPVAWITFTFDSTFWEKASTGSTLSSWVGGT